MASTREIAALRERVLVVVRRLAFLGPTLARITVGIVFLQTGWGKLHDLPRVIDFFTELHIPLPEFQARLVACTEFVGGLAMLFGLGTRFAAVPLSVTMVVAICTAKRGDLEGISSLVGFEEWSYLVFFIWLALAGAGPISLDYLIARRLEQANPKPNKTETETGE